MIDMHYVEYSERQCYSNKTNYSAYPDLAEYTNNSFLFQNISTCDNSYFLWHFKKNYPIRHKYISLPIKVHYPNGNSIFHFPW